MLRVFLFLAFAGVTCFVAAADAQTPPPSGSGTQGSPDVLVGGERAARQGDIMKDGLPITRGSSNVFINGKPAAIISNGNSIDCSSNVFVNGKPLARITDNSKSCNKR